MHYESVLQIEKKFEPLVLSVFGHLVGSNIVATAEVGDHHWIDVACFSRAEEMFRKTIVNKLRVQLARLLGLIRYEELKPFKPASKGSYKDLSKLTVQSSNQTIASLNHLRQRLSNTPSKIHSADEFTQLFQIDSDEVSQLKELLDSHGSDKASVHDYHLIYACLLRDNESIDAMLEIGLGTGDPGMVSNMGEEAKPGASLRAFQDFLPSAVIYGADVDRNILFEEKRIKTFFVDQTRPETFAELDRQIPEQLDLIIDDGLHAPHANIATLDYALTKLKPGGWCVIEDIPKRSLDVWLLVQDVLPSDGYRSFIVRTQQLHLFVCQKLS